MSRLIVLLLALSFAHPAAAQNSTPLAPARDPAAIRDEHEAQEAILDYIHALIARDGRDVLPRVTPATLTWYGEMLELAKYASREQLARRSTMDCLIVFMVRGGIPAEQLESMDAAGLLVHAVDRGWSASRITPETVAAFPIRVYGDRAAIDVGGGIELTALRIDGRWLVAVDVIAHQVAREMERYGLLTIDSVLASAAQAVGVPDAERLWQPVLPAPTRARPARRRSRASATAERAR